MDMWFKWLPWRFILSRLAKSRGFIDPVALLSHLHRFAQPSEVTEPIELMRAGLIFHARGLMNARAIQHNLDWVWPYWVERQFNPRDHSFVPRAFSITHVNLTHRNWTAVGLPECDWYPIVDPRGLVTPLLDGWSIDAWIVPEEGDMLFPSRAKATTQELRLDGTIAVRTRTTGNGMNLCNHVELEWNKNSPACRIHFMADSHDPAYLVIAIRPANPEGVSFIHQLEWQSQTQTMRVNNESVAIFDRAPQYVCMSRYKIGDVLQSIQARAIRSRKHITCDVGMATGALMFPLAPGERSDVTVRVDPPTDSPSTVLGPARTVAYPSRPVRWDQALSDACTLSVPDERMQFLFDAARHNLILHAPGEVYPGPYTYKRFWFRDACFILHALLATGLVRQARRAIALFPRWQSSMGHFVSQEGEWDSNGQVMWILHRYCQLTGQPLPDKLMPAVRKGARWMIHKRLSDTLTEPHAGLLPAGFSAEHLGPNDYYYWDDFWTLAGLHSAAALLEDDRSPKLIEELKKDAQKLEAAIQRSLERTEKTRDRPGIPASPYRRMDAGAIGSLAAGYPLKLFAADDPRLLDTVDFLYDHCRVEGGFFQDMIHSGINVYLTLHIAQVLLRSGDDRYWPMVERMAELASPTGQWPEAIHPLTLGGCMGDGQHMWAAAEWVMMMRNLFVREEQNRLIIGSGLPRPWLEQETKMTLGPTLTPHGTLSVTVTPQQGEIEVECRAQWRAAPQALEFQLAGCEGVTVTNPQPTVTVRCQRRSEP